VKINSLLNRRDFNLTLLAALPTIALRLPQSGNSLRIDSQRINSHLSELAQFGKTAEGGTSRVAYSDLDLKAREFVMKLMRDAKLEVTVDAAGNIVGRRTGTDQSLKPLMIGSHIDSVPDGGSYDGQVGSMGAIEVAQTLADRNVKLRHPLEVVIFQNEEGGTVGSAAMARGLTEKDLSVVSNSKKTIREGIKFIGGDPDQVSRPLRKKGDLVAYVELHIEQGPVLESMNRPTGVVQGTFGVERHLLRFVGQAAHSGSTPIPMRRDAFLAAAESALGFREIARKYTTPTARVVCTVGTIKAEPGIVTAVPGVCEISLDQRALDAKVLEQILADARQVSSRAATENNVTVEWKKIWSIDPRPFDPKLIALCTEAVQEVTGDAPQLPSGPLHDAAEMVPYMPVVMMFAYSSNGLSHCKEEDTPEAYLLKTIEAFLKLVEKVVTA